MSRFEQKPKYWSLFPMSDEDIREKEDFYDSKGWDLDNVPTHSGTLTLPDGTLVRIEGRFKEGQRGEFLTGTCYIPDKQPGGRGGDRGGRSRGRDDRGSRDNRGGGGRDNRRGGGRDERRDSRRDERSRPRDDRRGGYDDDEIPF